MSGNSPLGKARQKTKRSNSLSSSRTQPLRPLALPLASYRSLKYCLKCRGWLDVQAVDPTQKVEMRCLNCGWQPQFGERIIKESEEARSIRRFTAEFLSGSSRHTPTTSFEKAFRSIEISKEEQIRNSQSKRASLGPLQIRPKP